MNMRKYIAVLLSLSIILSSCGKSDKGNDVTRTPPSDVESVEKESEPKATDYSLSESPAVMPVETKSPSGYGEHPVLYTLSIVAVVVSMYFREHIVCALIYALNESMPERFKLKDTKNIWIKEDILSEG
ncbi:MAG: hypothetical protein LE168_01460 [Endomicrobium sp.]|nr:hypothetical protein [Endomicrobium sp.]